MAKVNRHDASVKGVNILKRALNKDKSKGKTGTEQVNKAAEPVNKPVTEPVNEPVAEPVTEPVNEPANNTAEPVTEPVTEPAKNAEPVTEPVTEPYEKISIFKDVKQATKEDSNINDKAQTLVDDQKRTEIEGEEISTKEANKAKASIIVELIDTGFMFICLLITWDFTKANQDFYTLNPERKKAIKYNLQKIYDNSNKKSEPKKVIIWLIVGSYIPLLVLAIFQLLNRLRDKKEKREREEREARENKEKVIPIEATTIPTDNGNNPKTDRNNENKNKDGRGRKPYPRDKHGNIIRPKKTKK